MRYATQGTLQMEVGLKALNTETSGTSPISHSIPSSRKADDLQLLLSVNGRQKLLYADEHWILYFIRRTAFALNNGQLFNDYNRPLAYLEWKVCSGRLQV